MYVGWGQVGCCESSCGVGLWIKRSRVRTSSGIDSFIITLFLPAECAHTGPSRRCISLWWVRWNLSVRNIGCLAVLPWAKFDGSWLLRWIIFWPSLAAILPRYLKRLKWYDSHFYLSSDFQRRDSFPVRTSEAPDGRSQTRVRNPHVPPTADRLAGLLRRPSARSHRHHVEQTLQGRSAWVSCSRLS